MGCVTENFCNEDQLLLLFNTCILFRMLVETNDPSKIALVLDISKHAFTDCFIPHLKLLIWLT